MRFHFSLKEIEEKHAEERLASRSQLTKSALISTAVNQSLGKDMSLFFKSYRELVDSDSSDSDDQDELENYDSDDDVHDEEPAPGGVVFSNH